MSISLLTLDDLRDVERRQASVLESGTLMERAGQDIASRLERELPPKGRVTILCGTGNNGGDGFTAARCLKARGHDVICVLVGGDEPKAEDAKRAFAAWQAVGGKTVREPDSLGKADIVVDAMLGIGGDRPIRGEILDATIWYNVQNSLMITSAILGVNYVNATPAELEPDPAIVEVARAFAAESGARITVTNDPVEAVENADAIYTNVWAAMGEESQFAERVKLMSPYQVNAELLSHVKNPDYIFLHCLPAFHNAETEYAADMAERFGVKEMEVTDEVFYSDHGRQFQQAENRMHTIKAIMAATLGDLYIPCV